MVNEIQSAEDFCKSLIAGFKEKANHNKNESMLCFWVSMGAALLAPLFVTLGADIAEMLGEYFSEIVFAKLIPSLLSIAAAFSTAWLQLRKPQQLWALYRTCQRELEDNLYKFQYKVAEYEHHPNPDNLLAKEAAEIALEAHHSWLPMVPNPESIQASNSNTSEEGN